MILLTIIGVIMVTELILFGIYVDYLEDETHHKRYWQY